MIVLKIANLQALAKQPATSSIGQNYTPADSRTPLLALRTCPPSYFWGFLEINFFEFFHSYLRRKARHSVTSPQQFLLQHYSQGRRKKCSVDSDKEKQRWSLVTPNDKLLLAPPIIFCATVDAKVTEHEGLSAVFEFYCKMHGEMMRSRALWRRMTLPASRYAAGHRSRMCLERYSEQTMMAEVRWASFPAWTAENPHKLSKECCNGSKPLKYAPYSMESYSSFTLTSCNPEHSPKVKVPCFHVDARQKRLARSLCVDWHASSTGCTHLSRELHERFLTS